MVDRRRGFTLVEILIAAGLSTMVIGGAWMLFGTLMGGGNNKASAIHLTAESFLRQEALTGIRALTRRLQESIQILEPQPGRSSSTLIFKDLINERTVLTIQNGALVGLDGEGAMEPQRTLTANGKAFNPTRPIKIPGCSEALFTVLSPTCVTVQLTFAGDGDKQAQIVNTVHLQNENLAR